MAPKGPISRSSGSKPSDELRITGMSTIADRLGFRPRNHDALGDRNHTVASLIPCVRRHSLPFVNVHLGVRVGDQTSISDRYGSAEFAGVAVSGSRLPGEDDLPQIKQHRRSADCIRNMAEGVGFEPTRACTLAVFKPVAASFATVRGRSPASAAYFTLALFVRRSSPAFTIVRRGCRHWQPSPATSLTPRTSLIAVRTLYRPSRSRITIGNGRPAAPSKSGHPWVSINPGRFNVPRLSVVAGDVTMDLGWDTKFVWRRRTVRS